METFGDVLRGNTQAYNDCGTSLTVNRLSSQVLEQNEKGLKLLAKQELKNVSSSQGKRTQSGFHFRNAIPKGETSHERGMWTHVKAGMIGRDVAKQLCNAELGE